MNNEQFRDTVKQYLEVNGISQFGLAKRIGVSPQTISNWIQRGCVTDDGRARIVGKYPFLFAIQGQGEQLDDLPLSVSRATLCPLERIAKDSIRPVQTFVKTEFARQHVASLSEILVWFLFKATSEERQQFRDELGEEWRNFLSLTRAMTGELAFKVIEEEGALQKWGQQQ
jgi:hypothetical protein